MNKTILAILTCAVIFTSCKNKNVATLPRKKYTLSVESLKMYQTNVPYHFYNRLTFVNEATGYALSGEGKIINTIDCGYNRVKPSLNGAFHFKRI